jgi:hypothetical protein
MTALLASALSSKAGLAADNDAQGSSSASLETSSDFDTDLLSLVTSPSDRANRDADNGREAATNGRSLLLMEIRTQHRRAAAAATKAAVLDLDPRTKPLGW